MDTYQSLLEDPRWQRKRLEVLERAKWTCEACGDTTTSLHVNHLRYASNRGMPWEVPDEWLECLCKKCHRKRTAFDFLVPGRREVRTSLLLKVINNVAEQLELYCDENELQQSESPISNALIQPLARANRLTISTGFQSVDEIIAGFRNGELSIVAGRPGMGKTALAINIIGSLLPNMPAGEKTIFFSFENTKHEIVERLMCAVAKVSVWHARQNMLSHDELENIKHVSGQFVSMNNLIVCQDTEPSISRLVKVCERYKSYGLALLVFDHMSRKHPFSSADIKSLAIQLDVPVLCLAEMYRSYGVGPENRPTIQQVPVKFTDCADTVMLLHRPAYYATDGDRSEAEIVVARSSNGKTGTAKLTWQRDISRFESRLDPKDGGDPF